MRDGEVVSGREMLMRRRKKKVKLLGEGEEEGGIEGK